ncbi:hypothetical protein QAD02_010362 [Eretmocerus hayati]|uniref:Uncharacterized protein n=1 Tax=Eretmocerus hayati TaxID=131215 RepID=A0ACC2NCA7_9HYME|nr:hypothetical protein QAD02_010362 [Eretmocerus hayati]
MPRWSIGGSIVLLWMCHMAVHSDLQKVDLSDQNLDRENFLMKLQHEMNIREIKELILRGNCFDVFLDCSYHLENLQILDLSHNRLRKFFFLCQSELNLEILNVSHNQIEYINDEALSAKVVKLKTLDVSYNDLYIVNDTMLRYMENLEFLSLASNPIQEELDDWVFGNLSKLRYLDLRNVSLGRFTEQLFSPLTSLEHLDLSDNPLESLPTKLSSSLRVLIACGTNLKRIDSRLLQSMPQLKVLSLERSHQLDSLVISELTGLEQLEIFSLNNSPKFRQIELQSVESQNDVLPKLKHVSLSNCSLESITPTFEKMINKDTRVDLDGNPWRCDCNLGWMIGHGPNETRELATAIRCQSPEESRGKLLSDLRVGELECKDDRRHRLEKSNLIADMGHDMQTLLPILISVLGLLGLLTACLALAYLSRNRLWDWVGSIRRRRDGESVSYTSYVESENDLACILSAAAGHRHTHTQSTDHQRLRP